MLRKLLKSSNNSKNSIYFEGLLLRVDASISGCRRLCMGIYHITSTNIREEKLRRFRRYHLQDTVLLWYMAL